MPVDERRDASRLAVRLSDLGLPDGAETEAAVSWGGLLRRYRGLAGLTQEELAEQSGYSTDYISKLERDQRLPPLVAIDRLAAVLRLGPGERETLRAARARPVGARVAPAAGMEIMGLPTQATSFVGRQHELAAVTALLRRDDVHLLTLTGLGGIGKTRLALRVASELADTFPDGVIFVPLASLGEPDQVAAMVAATVGLKETSGTPVAQTVTQYLRHRQTLLLLDNFEHLLPAAPFVAALVTACPRLRILITSRALLQLSAEHRYEVPPLSTADPDRHGDAATIARQEAVALFVDRARAVRDSFTLTDANAVDVSAICRCLDGLPLAIELAAARVRLFPPRALLQQLAHRFSLLVGGARDQPARHQTLRGTMDWSHQLLSVSEQVLFARLSVFAGGCSLQAVEEVCNLDSKPALVEELSSLVDKSLVRQDGEHEPRFSLLETIREYAAEKLTAGAEQDTIRRRHAEHFLAMTQAVEPALAGPQQDACLDRLDTELDNLREALGWLLERGRVAEELCLAGALYPFWLARGHCREGRRWLEEGLARGTGLTQAARAQALWGLGGIAVQLGDYVRGSPLLEEALSLCHGLDDAAGTTRALNLLGVIAWRQATYARAITLYEEALPLATVLGDQRERAFALLNLGISVYRQGDRAAGRQYLEEALALNRARGDRHATLHALFNLGYDATLRGDLSEAQAMLEEVLATARGLKIRNFVAYALENLATVSTLQGNHEQAAVELRETLLLGRELGDRYLLVFALADLAKLEVARGRLARAVRLGGMVAGLQELLGIAMAPMEDQDREQVLARARADLGEAPFRRAWESGQGLSLDEAVADALEEAAAR
jgi:predicted ATPase/transcriptional regulator with XRE-family HTH domain